MAAKQYSSLNVSILEQNQGGGFIMAIIKVTDFHCDAASSVLFNNSSKSIMAA